MGQGFMIRVDPLSRYQLVLYSSVSMGINYMISCATLGMSAHCSYKVSSFCDFQQTLLDFFLWTEINKDI